MLLLKPDFTLVATDKLFFCGNDNCVTYHSCFGFFFFFANKYLKINLIFQFV